MRIVSIKSELLSAYSKDNEVLKKSGRPCVLVIRLKYKGKNRDFAIPMWSNIICSAPKEQYFPLPPRKTTRPKNRHGLHYIKMFPVTKKYLERYRIEGNEFSIMLQRIIDENQKEIVIACQEYLNKYENGERPPFSTNIDYLISILDSI